jgi:hypothetical protein
MEMMRVALDIRSRRVEAGTYPLNSDTVLLEDEAERVHILLPHKSYQELDRGGVILG